MKHLFILSLFLFLSCNTKKEAENTSDNTITENIVTLTEGQLQNAKIETGKLVEKKISSLLKVNGKIDVPPQNMVSISMPLGGYLKTTQLLPGMHVTKGQVIAKMEDQQYIEIQQNYLTVKSKLAYAEKEFVRQKELNHEQASSDKIFQQAETDYRNLSIERSALAEKLKLININPQTLTINTISKTVNMYSPIDGFVSKVNVNIGKYVNPADVLFELVNPSDIHLNLKIFEKDLPKLYIGQKLIAYNNNTSKKYPCEILLISKDLSVDEHSADVHCHFMNYDKNLFPGMYMNADIEIKDNKALTLPTDAIVNFEGDTYIFIEIAQNKYRMTPIKIGSSENGHTEIIDGLKYSQDVIVTKGAYTLLMKLKNKSDE